MTEQLDLSKYTIPATWRAMTPRMRKKLLRLAAEERMVNDLARMSGESVEQVQERLARLPCTVAEVRTHFLAFGEWPEAV